MFRLREDYADLRPRSCVCADRFNKIYIFDRAANLEDSYRVDAVGHIIFQHIIRINSITVELIYEILSANNIIMSTTTGPGV